MKKILSKALSVVVFITMILPSTGTVFAETVGQVTGTIITAKNNAGMPDTLTVTGLVVGDIVKVYSIVQLDGSGIVAPVDVSAIVTGRTVTQIGTATAKADKATKGATVTTASATVSAEFPVMGGLFEEPAGGFIYVTVKRKGLHESTAQKVPYEKEGRTPLIKVDNVSVENNAGIPDTVTVEGLEVGDIVKVYSESVSGEQVATQTTTKTQTYIFLVTIEAQLTNAIKEANTKLEYARKCAIEGANQYQLQSMNQFAKDIFEAGGNYGYARTADIAAKLAATASEKVNAVDKLLVAKDAAVVAAKEEAVVSASPIATESEKIAAMVKLNNAITARFNALNKAVNLLQDQQDIAILTQLTTNSDYAVTPENKITLEKLVVAAAAEASRAATAAEPASAALSKLAEATTIFEGAFLKAPIGTATAKADKATKTAKATISIPQLYEDEGNIENTNRRIYVTVTKKGLLESYKVGPKGYIAEAVTDMPSSIVTVVNNALELDTITVKDLKLGDVVTIYEESKKGAKPIGTAIAKADKLAKGEKLAKDAIPTATATLSITLPKSEGGSIYISVTTKAKRESEKSKAVPYGAEGQTNPPSLQLQ
ncbi:hypothetical protein [Clostridium sp. FP1]|uniref:hypothetical protein n=1 Tax=Clostridium sp. FP1 TaxID=2724076 RepID=UPI0013E9784C|nr:hypothetical protein [Clostridium sp. FP1]MBZ9636543.1 hypothetical protein [Clostridium sp. FP1]